MYKIAICDDEQREIDKANQLLDEYQAAHLECDFAVCTYTDSRSLMDAMEQGIIWDILLLDIYLTDGMTGIEIARQLRDRGFEGAILFLTTSKEHGIDAFEVEAQQYLLKPIDKQRFFDAIAKALKRAEEKKVKYLLFRSERETHRVVPRDIVHVESQNQYQLLYLTGGGKLRVRITLTQLFDMLAEFDEFMQIGKSHIVNLNYVESLNAKSISLTDGTRIWLPRGSYAAVRQQYFKFYMPPS